MRVKVQLILLLLLAAAARAKFITGVVVDAATGAPVPDAAVTILDETVLSDSRGEFRLTFDGFGVLEVKAGERFAPYRRPVGRSERVTVALIPAVTRQGEILVSFLDFFRDASRSAPGDPDTRWRHRWDSPPRVYPEPGLDENVVEALEEAFAGPRFPDTGYFEFTRSAEDELRAEVLVQSAQGRPGFWATYDAQSGRVVGGVVNVAPGDEPAELVRFFAGVLMQLHGFAPLGEDDPRRPLSVLGDAPTFTRLDALALATARRLPADTRMGWYGNRLPVDREARRQRVLALPFAVTYEDPYMSHIAAATVREALDEYGPLFHVVLAPELLELGGLADQGLPAPGRFVRGRPFRLEEAVEAAVQAGCRFVFWGELTNSGKSSSASFYAADARTGARILNMEVNLPDRLHFPRFLAEAGLALAREIAPRERAVRVEDGVLRIFFTTRHRSTYVHALVDDSLAAVLSESAGDFKLALPPGPHRVEFRYYLPMRHLGCVAGIFAGDRAFSVEVASGTESSVATLYGMNPTETGRAWNYAKTKVIGPTGAVVLEESHDLFSERRLWLDSFSVIERLRTPKPD
ncbi:MAG TPA: carboxypeptidase regulatory-like domain-containing protein [Candidatus Coatesbacteria bacterium]|nr:carboxypeptidase regulatory-like domain-containing protein [Candidatus Coatesbacteria bacterium]